MKRYIITLILLITCTFTLTGCRNQTTDSGFKGNVEIAWDDVKDDFDQIDQDVENDTSKQDVKALTQTILDGYDKIKEGITQDNQEEAKKVYAAASRLEYIEKNTDQKLSSEEKEILELGKKTKTLMMHYYGNGEGIFQDAVDDVENGIDRVKNFTEEKWNDFKDKLDIRYKLIAKKSAEVFKHAYQELQKQSIDHLKNNDQQFQREKPSFQNP